MIYLMTTNSIASHFRNINVIVILPALANGLVRETILKNYLLNTKVPDGEQGELSIPADFPYK